MSVLDELLKLEKGFWEGAQDPDYYRENMAEDGFAVFAAPYGVMGKDQAIESTQHGTDDMQWTSFEFKNPRLLQITDDVAALTYTGEAMRGNEPYSANSTSVYVRRDGRWQLAVHQQSANAAVPATR